ncbi:hypothetical protein [Shewanella sp. UCD-KL12]|uniref:hypothetical protein n=1 Tax=Shewanella sp. UCD-KL12 TaxID=1917163 RepID=UPI0015C37496|nr:hypothetical protein [Shewanella sp. UCD-KL12]
MFKWLALIHDIQVSRRGGENVNHPPSEEGGFKVTPYKGALVTVHLQVALDISL